MGRATIPRMNLTESRALASRLASLLRQEHHALADFLVALADLDRRRGWVELGHSGLFPFLHCELGLSKASAFFRKTAAELIQRFPEIAEPLRDGRLCLTTMASLSKVLTPENRAEVLPEVLPPLRAGGQGHRRRSLRPRSRRPPAPSSPPPRSAPPSSRGGRIRHQR